MGLLSWFKGRRKKAEDAPVVSVASLFDDAQKTPVAPAAPKSTAYLLPGETTAAIRAWALANGHIVSPKGRLPKAVLTAYRAANGES